MTCIVGIEHEGTVYIAGDSAGVDGCGIRTVRADEKVFVVGGIVYGFTTSFRMGQILRYSFVPPQRNDKGDMAYLATDFVQEARRCFKEHGYEQGGTFLIGYRGHLYRVDEDYQVGRSVDDFQACGAGYEVALGSLFSSVGEPPIDRCKLALAASAHFVTSVHGPFNIEQWPEK